MTKEEKKKMKKEKLKLKEKKHKKFNTFVGFILGMYLTVSAYLIFNIFVLAHSYSLFATTANLLLVLNSPSKNGSSIYGID